MLEKVTMMEEIIQESYLHQMRDGMLNLDTKNQSILVMSIHTKEDKMSFLLEFSSKLITLNMLLKLKSKLIWIT
jgi:acyl-CoA hydrolase